MKEALNMDRNGELTMVYKESQGTKRPHLILKVGAPKWQELK